MKIKILLIDDDPKDISIFESIFNSNEFAIEHFSSAACKLSDFNFSLFNDFTPDIFLIDFHFDRPGGNEFLPDGFVLSTLIKNKFNDIPIILFTRRNIFNIQDYPKQITEIVDKIIYKKEVHSGNFESLFTLYSIARGYKSLRDSSEKNWATLKKLLNMPDDSDLELIDTERPLGNDGTWKVADTASWVLKVLLKYPGIIYDELYAATFLGISLRAFKEINHDFELAAYEGIFKPSGYYYWRKTLSKIAIDLMSSEAVLLPISLGFRMAWEKKNGHALEPAICNTSGESGADRVCYILNEPVKTKWSFVYNIDNRPSVMDEARVSWKAIRTTDEVNEEFLSEIAREMLPEIKSSK